MKGNVGSELSMETVPRFLQLLQQWHGKQHLLSDVGQQQQQQQQTQTVALVLGSSVWDVLQSTNLQQGSTYDDHLRACRELVTAVRERYPMVALFWKSPSALHVHRVGRKCREKRSCSDRIRYMSTSRVFYLHTIQRELMSELQVPYLNLYNAYYLSADSTMDGDGRHFDAHLNAKMLSYFYNATTTTVSAPDD